ncbi:hypothetical protein [Streptomyces viridochromogenes]|uniref:hypothetical protein n=1 Tax=Streptomyces viridochromogenes TaxID=1938 RepID=UPI00030D68DB|nr:hypothetical protein [Streptomyces viridochromogenes]
MGGTSRQSEKPRPESAQSGTQIDPEPVAAPPSLPRRADRSGLIVAGAALAACAGLVAYGILDTGPSDDKPEHRTPTASVTYEVTGRGAADITYQARSETGKATVVKAAALPWRKTVDVPVGQDPIVSIVLTEQGGQARCTLAIRGRHVQTATATGTFGRATCAGALSTAAGTAS